MKLATDMRRNTTYIVDSLLMCQKRWFTYPIILEALNLWYILLKMT